MLIRSSIAIGIFTALMGVAVDVWQMFAFRGLMGIFAGFSGRRDRAGRRARCRRTGSATRSAGASTGQLVGSLVGPVIGGLLADLTGSYRIPFFCTSAVLFAATAAVWFIVQEQFAKPQQQRRARLDTEQPRRAGALADPAGAVFRLARAVSDQVG